MSIVVRDVRARAGFRPRPNNAAGPAILPLDANRLRRFFRLRRIFPRRRTRRQPRRLPRRLRPDAGHDSDNYAWFRERYPRFFYIDRIVVASRRRGGGVGRAFYADVQSHAELRYPHLACEVFLEQGNDRRCCSTAASASAKSANGRAGHRPRGDADEGTVQLRMGARHLRRPPAGRAVVFASAPAPRASRHRHLMAHATWPRTRTNRRANSTIGQVGIANLRVRTLDVEKLAEEMRDRVARAEPVRARRGHRRFRRFCPARRHRRRARWSMSCATPA